MKDTKGPTHAVGFASHVERAPLELAEVLEENKDEGGNIFGTLLSSTLQRDKSTLNEPDKRPGLTTLSP
jgi:hypothetical protein